jgi:NAD(P)-dependent dehydrogenase (short-subunit alcohol dehydrogenase family)
VKTVLVTGAAGYIGSYILPAFRERFSLRLVDNRDRDGLGRPVEGLQVRDISDLNRMDEYRDLFRGADAVVHLAFMRPPTEGLHQRYLAERANVDMAYLVYQLALEEGVRRFVVASSNHATDFYERPLRTKQLDTVYPDHPRPLADNFYGWAYMASTSADSCDLTQRVASSASTARVELLDQHLADTLAASGDEDVGAFDCGHDCLLRLCLGASRRQPASRLSLRICLSKTHEGTMRRSVLTRPAVEPAV